MGNTKKNHFKFPFLIGLLLLLAILIPIFIYLIIFYHHPLSDNGSNWGDFGNYLGGILNPIIGIFNVVVLVYLTLKVSELDNVRNERALELQRELGIKKIKYKSYKEINALFLRISFVSIDEGKLIDGNKYLKLKSEFISITTSCLDLFKSLNVQRINKIADLIFNMEVCKR